MSPDYSQTLHPASQLRKRTHTSRTQQDQQDAARRRYGSAAFEDQGQKARWGIKPVTSDGRSRSPMEPGVSCWRPISSKLLSRSKAILIDRTAVVREIEPIPDAERRRTGATMIDEVADPSHASVGKASIPASVVHAAERLLPVRPVPVGAGRSQGPLPRGPQPAGLPRPEHRDPQFRVETSATGVHDLLRGTNPNPMKATITYTVGRTLPALGRQVGDGSACGCCSRCGLHVAQPRH